jgi:sodium transport system permease protein
MSWTNVKLILGREVRDQLRDRRTLFMIAVLPILLYPLLGMSFLQIQQVMQERPTKVLVIGEPDILTIGEADSDKLADLFHRAEKANGDTDQDSELYFNYALFPASDRQTSEDRAQLLPVTFEPVTYTDSPDKSLEQQFELEKQRAAAQSDHEVVVLFPPEFVERLKQRALLKGSKDPSSKPLSPVIYRNSSRDKSKIAYGRVNDALNRWMDRISAKVLKEHKIPVTATQPFTVTTVDVAAEGHSNAGLWSKLLPFVLFIWALTGAFYPAVDLCAGEKERGTLETLLSSPAERSEIVVGKLLTVMLFSVTTAVLNLVSMSVTGQLILSQIKEFDPPPMGAMVWLLVALVPVSAMFSAVCLALAALARSTKEGQYYLMPVMLITMPLVMLPMSPGVEMNLGNSLVPVMGIVLLLRTALEGDYATAAQYIIPALGVTLICCLLAIRWAIDQFNKESVLFRESERFDMNLWIKQLFRERQATPTVAAAFLCGLLILMLKFMLSTRLPAPNPDGPIDEFLRIFTISTTVLQIAFIAAPALLMTVMLTRSPRETLLLKMPRWTTIPAAIGLAVCIHPVLKVLGEVVVRLYPMNPQIIKNFIEPFTKIIQEEASVWHLLLLIAVLPAICEELAFRGFILSGFRHLGNRRAAIVLSAIFFGVIHSFIQQSVMACFSGVLLGYLAIRTGSLLPCILYHMTSNGLNVLSGRFGDSPQLAWLLNDQDIYHTWVVSLAGMGAILLLLYFRSLDWESSKEEALQDALNHEQDQDEPAVN